MSIKSPEEIFDLAANKHMISYELTGFKKTHPTLLKTIMIAIESYHSQFVEQAEGWRVDSLLIFLETIKNRIIRLGDNSSDDFNRSVYFSHAGEIDRAIYLIQQYEEYLAVSQEGPKGEDK